MSLLCCVAVTVEAKTPLGKPATIALFCARGRSLLAHGAEILALEILLCDTYVDEIPRQNVIKTVRTDDLVRVDLQSVKRLAIMLEIEVFAPGIEVGSVEIRLIQCIGNYSAAACQNSLEIGHVVIVVGEGNTLFC